MKYAFKGLMGAAAVITIVFASASNASTITEDFDNPAISTGSHTYSDQGFTYDPLTLQNSQRCFDDRCFLEVAGGNGNPVHLTEDNDTTFDLLSFYFNFQGRDPNTLKVGSNGELPAGGDPATDFVYDDFITIALGSSYDGTGAVSIFDVSGTQVTTALVQQTGYFAIINNNLFDGVEMISFDAVENKNIRIDCVSVSPEGTNASNISAGDLSSCAPSVTPIPVPAAAWLLMAGIGGFGAMGAMRRKKS